MGNSQSRRLHWAATSAAAWCVAFASLHLFWAFGGSVGLASSAGYDLAARRPAWFVLFGLYGVAAALLFGAVVICVAATRRLSARRRRIVTWLVTITGVGLLVRGVALQVILAADVGGVRGQLGQREANWSLILWNPWFMLGGMLFIAAAALSYGGTRRPRPQ